MSEVKVCTGTISLECSPKPPPPPPPPKPPKPKPKSPFWFLLAVLVLLMLTGIGGGAHFADDAICVLQDDCHEPEKKPHKPHRRVLKHGSRGEDVKRLQKVLIARGFSPKSFVPDGVFGPTTKKAVKAFQRQAKIRADGVVGRETWDKIFASS